MRLILKDTTDTIKENYLQSLALLYLPCETFSPTEEEEKLLSVSVNVSDGGLTAELSFKYYDKTACAHRFETLADTPEEPFRLQVKLLVGGLFLKAAKELFGYLPPWGIVTGIRPAKLAADYLNKYGDQETKRILCEKYFVHPNRADLCIRTAANEKRLVAPLFEKPFEKTCSLYISIPFCPSKCRYCSFVSATTPRLLALIPAYFEKLLDEIASISETIRALGLKLCSVYVGGGTPAVLSADQIAALTEKIHQLFDMTGVEFTFEAGRPDCITIEKLQSLKDGGVTRISINTQTANNDVLAAVGRKHTFEDYEKCMNDARKVGISCINTDLIAGLPGETAESFCESVRKVCQLSPENVTVHAFTLKRSSEYKTAHTAHIDSASRTAFEMISSAGSFLTNRHYEPYYMYRQKNTVGNLDNTGFSLSGYECLYNIYMMGEYHTVFAAGAGAVTKYVSRDRERIERTFCVKYPYEYLDPQKYPGFDRAFAEHFYQSVYEKQRQIKGD